jgi:sugar-specific transcriptional regulator TrmB
MLEKLQKIGFTEKESQVYQELVRKGKSSANIIAKNLATHRTVVYNILQQLVEKGYVSYVTQNNKRIFSISSPKSILSEIKEKENLANELIKEISSYKAIQQSNNKVEVYEGIDGMRIIHDDIKKEKHIRILNATGLIFEKLKFSAKHIVNEMFEGHKIIAVQSMKKTPLSKFKKFQIKYLPKNAENYATTFIFDGKIIIQILKDKPFIIKIENNEIYEGYSKNFDLLWKSL